MKSLAALPFFLFSTILAFAQPVDNCQEAVVNCIDPSTGFFGSTADGTAGSVPAFCGSIEVDQWFTFVAATSAPITLTAMATSSVNGDGVQIAVYESCDGAMLACNVGCSFCAGEPLSVTLQGLVVGQQYFFLIDGLAGDQCDYIVSVDPADAMQSNSLAATGVLDAPAMVCQGDISKFCMDEVIGATKYVWVIPKNAILNGISGPDTIELAAPDGRCADIVWTLAVGQQSVYMSPANFCGIGAPSYRDIEVLAAPKTFFPPIDLCLVDAANQLLVWGDPIDVAVGKRTYIKRFPQMAGCDSILLQKVTIRDVSTTDLGLILTCKGGSIVVGGEQYFAEGDYIKPLVSSFGCDSLLFFQLRFIDATAEIIGPTTTCAGATVNLSAGFNQFATSEWFDGAGNLLENQLPYIFVSAPGTYFLKNTVVANGQICTDIDSIVIVQSTTAAPIVTVEDMVFDCINGFSTLTALCDDPFASIEWYQTGTGNFQGSGPYFSTSTPGSYTAVATGADGCSSSAAGNILESGLVGTYSIAQNPTIELPQPASTIAFSLANMVKNQTADPVQIRWDRTIISLSPNCSVSVGDPSGWYSIWQENGVFTLAANESGPLNLEFSDDEANICCGLVLLKLINQCSSMDTLTAIFDAKCTVATTDFESVGARIYPNPSDGHFVFEQKTGRAAKLEVIDLLGKVVFSANLSEKTGGFSIAGQPAGSYFAVLRDADGAFLGVEKLEKH